MSEHGDGTRNPMKEVRKVLKLTQEEMAEQLACSTTTVRRCERKGTVPRRNQTASTELRRMARQASIEIKNEPTDP
jgi:DNA-binding XRE family transcriptional regulator